LPVSIYRPVRKFDPTFADAGELAAVPVRDRGGPVVAYPDPGAERWGHLRKAIPVDRLLPATVSWAARLPEPVRPYALMQHYPRVANRVAAAAASPTALAECLADLLISQRGGRRGFPAPVAQELLHLRGYADELTARPRAGVAAGR
jgi:hypothetical protein